MSPAEIRLALVKHVAPSGVANLNADMVIKTAKALEQYVIGEGHATPAPSQQPMTNAHQTGQSAHYQQPRRPK